MQPWIDPATRHKIKLLGGESKLHQALDQEGISLDQVPECAGGRHPGISVHSALLGIIDGHTLNQDVASPPQA